MYHATIRKTTYSETGVPTRIDYSDTCGHQHRDLASADKCVDVLSKRNKLVYGEACIVERVDGEKLSPHEIAELAASYGVNLK